MAGYRATQIRKPANETEFEKNCVVLFRELLGDPGTKRVGTRGQKQHGMDIIGHRDLDPKRIVGIQCKLKSGRSKLTKKEVRGEIKAALGYKPSVSEYFIVATSKDDGTLLPIAQEVMQQTAAVGRIIQIEIWGWDTLQEHIDQHESAKNAFDPGWSPSLAGQNRKLDTLLKRQKTQVTSVDVSELAANIQRNAEERVTKLPVAFADRELKEQLSRIMRRRGFSHTDIPAELASLAERSISADLSLGSTFLRAEICDRAARANAVLATAARARAFRAAAAQLDPSRDLFIADALLLEADGDADAAIRQLRARADAETRSALFIALVRKRDGEAALQWARSEQLEPAAFNPPGAVNLVLHAIERGEFEHALNYINNTPASYFAKCPALRLLRAQLTLAAMLPEDRKAYLFQGLPLNPKELELADGVKARDNIKRAGEDIRALLGLLNELDLGFLRGFLTEFELWLRLEDRDTRAAARAELALEIADPVNTLQRVRLALAYNVPFNQEALQRHLAARKELGGWTPEERFAALLMAYHSGDLKRLSEFFDKNHNDLFLQSDLLRPGLAAIEIEVLARSGRFADARAHIALHMSQDDLTPEQTTFIEDLVAHIEKDDEVEAHRQRYEKFKRLSDIRMLVAGLRARGDATQLATYAPKLVRETRTAEDFDVAIKALHQSDRLDELLVLTDELPDLLTLNDDYASLKGWALFRLGRVMEARTIARTLIRRRGATPDRELGINTAIESGDWGYLQALLAEEVQRADTIATSDLIRMARLALEVNSPYVDHFRDAALRKAPGDPQVNLAAYMLATERGEEYRGFQAQKWFEKAVTLSGADGPVRSVSIREMVDHATGWNERTQNIDGMLRRAEIPLFMIARAVRRQLIDLTLGQALRNADPTDKRLKYPVFAFFGVRPNPGIAKETPVALDITCLITLDYVGLLQKVIDHFNQVVIGPSTLSHLFMERQFIRVQQPSEMAKAGRIQALIAAGALKVIAEDAESPPALAKEIGRDLATLLSEARREGGLVVRSAPVAQLGTFLDQYVDMSKYTAELTDTLSALAFLAQSGKIDAPTRQSAETYLQQVDKGWPSSPAISAASKLYLDDLTVTHLDHVGLLNALIGSVAAVFVHGDLDARTRETLHYGDHAEELLAAIDRIRAVVNTGVESGKIIFSARRLVDESEDEGEGKSSGASPSLDLMSNVAAFECVLVDDRCLNKLPTWTDGAGKHANAGTTLDLLAALRSAHQLDENSYWRLRHKLRASGYYAMPIEAEELLHHLDSAPIEIKQLRETPELKAVRESIAIPIINNAFLPAEQAWVNAVRFAIIQAIPRVWVQNKDNDVAEARATWLLSILPNPMEWCVHPQSELVWAAARQQTAVQVGLLMFFLQGTPEKRRRYFSWLDRVLLEPLKKAHREVWDAVIVFLKDYMTRLMEAAGEN